MRMHVRIFLFVFLALPLAAHADESQAVQPLSCGIYDEAVKPFIEKDLSTQSADARNYTMAITTTSGKRLSVSVQHVSIRLPGERNNVYISVDGKPYAKTSHQDVPLYVEVTIDGVKYRIICLRSDLVDVSSETGTEKKHTPPVSSR